MTMPFLAPRGATPADLTRAERRAFQGDFDRPTLILDTDQVAENFHALSRGLGEAAIHYAVKANPAPEVLARLVGEGAHFDAASRGEIALCLAAGAPAAHISFGNTVKRASDIAFAHAAGVTLFAADAEEELEKIALNAPGAEVYVRVLVSASGADWPLTRKFGCTPAMAMHLFAVGRALGLRMVGLSFHVGSQTRRAQMWAPVLDDVARLWHDLRRAGHAPQLLNIGGGFPAFYGEEIDGPERYAAEVMTQVRARFGPVARLMAEPGRGLVANAGAIAAEVLLVARKDAGEQIRWVTLDIGKFSGLAETIDEAIRYRFLTARDGAPTAPCILAGPSCDSFDVLYEKTPVDLPATLAAGDRIVIRNCGAYTSSYASVGFNGFPPLAVEVLDTAATFAIAAE